jgi:release factor glutamine methyltransferase
VTIHDRVASARQRLRAAGIPDPEADMDARLLAQEVLGWDSARFFASANEAPPTHFADRYDAAVRRRAAREPIAYILGRQDFWDLTFEVSPAVLIPRPETELIVEAALGLFPNRAAPLIVADVCTGSGCVAVALAHERTRASVVATDVSDEALTMARRNAVRYGVADRIRFVRTDVLDDVSETFHLVLSNPPYVPERDRRTLQPEVRDHEPGIALFAGHEGLAVIRRLVAAASRCLEPDGILIFEFGFGQEAAVTELISAAPCLTMVELRRDLQGIPRTAIVKRS